MSCLCYTSLMNRLHILKAVVTAVKLSVVVKRGMYRTNSHNYRITKNYFKMYQIQTRSGEVLSPTYFPMYFV